MPSIIGWLGRAAEPFDRLLPLALVPLVATLLDVGRLAELLEPDDRVFSVTFGVPRAVTTLWSFLNVQAQGVSLGPVGLAALSPAVVLATVASVVVTALLAAGYLGSIDACLDGEYEFVAELRRYARPFVGLGVLQAAVGIGVLAPAILFPPLLVPAFAVVLGLAYLFFAAPYLIVTDGLSLVPALRKSYGVATADGRCLGFFLGYVVVNAVASVPVSWLAFNYGPAGVALAVLVVAPVALLLNTATLLFVRSLSAGDGGAQSNMPVDM